MREECAVAYTIEGNKGFVWWLPITEIARIRADARALRKLGIKARVVRRKFKGQGQALQD